jgi:hypothetical protein
MPSKIVTFLLFLLFIHTKLPAQSVFNTGSWYKIGVVESKVYKLDFDFLEKNLGINTSKIDPKTVKIYGSGGGMLPQENSIARNSDPQQKPITAIGIEDGKFDKSDYFLFFAEGPNLIKLQANGSLLYDKHDYCDTAYYFLTYGETDGLRMSTTANAPQGKTEITAFNDFIVFEPDEYKLFESGREWYSNPLKSRGNDQLFRDFKYNVPGVKDSIGINISLLGASVNPASFDITFNDQLLGNIPLASISEYKYSYQAYVYEKIYSIQNNNSENLHLNVKFNEDISDFKNSRGYIDYFILGFDRNLKLYGDQTSFRSIKGMNGSRTYKVSKDATSNSLIWNITDRNNPKNQEFISTTTLLSFGEPASTEMTEYVVFDPLKIPKPTAFGKVPNQNIKAFTDADGIIISAPEFLSEARRLADFHQTHDGLTTAVVTPREIYNEFSSGTQDLTALRDYLRYIWLNGGNKLKYALLFGDGSYDYKHKLTAYPDQNLVPVYESRESIHRLYSHSSDDYYGFFEENEGDWYEGDPDFSGRPKEGTYHDHTQEIGIGRLPVKNQNEARLLVDKIIRYATSPNTTGKWRTEVTYLADDGDRNDHMIDVEKLAKIMKNDFASYNVNRLYLDNYEQPKNTCPTYRDAVMQKFSEGSLIIDYLGHGQAEAIMQEKVIDSDVIETLNNRHKLPLMVTATCNFGEYDNPTLVSGAERLLLHPNGGAIAMLSTTRAVYASTNFLVNKALHDCVFSRDENGNHPRLGDVMRITKNNSLQGPINRNFALLGDPMLTLNYPEFDVFFNSFESIKDTLSALQHVSIIGNICHSEEVITNFNGIVNITLWDIPRSKRTLGLDNPALNGLPLELNNPFSYEEQDNALFRGDVSVKNGTFEMSFILPKNASYKYQQGRLAAYALSSDGKMDASGASQNFVIGGSAPLQTDNTPPNISVYLNEPTFKNGSEVGPSSFLIASVFDENGINISSNGYNQSITLTLNDSIVLILNDFYTASLDDYSKGKIVYPLQNLAAGRYHGELKVWDVYNNYTIKSVDFKVSDQPKIQLFNVKNYPNPISATGATTFSFDHDKVGAGLSINIAIYDMQGSVVNIWEQKLDDTIDKKIDIPISILTSGGDQLMNGVYFYKLRVTSTSDGATNEIINRLLINN